MAYLNAKKVPITRPGIEMINIELPPIDAARSNASTPEAKEAIMNIRTMDFVAANSSELTGYSISGLLS